MEKKRILEEQEQREFLKDIVIRDKDTLLLRIKQSMEDIVHEDSVMELKPMEYYKRLKLLFNRFYEKVTKLPLMYISDECWGYGFRITEWGVVLNLIKVGVDYEIFSENENSIEIANFPFPFLSINYQRYKL